MIAMLLAAGRGERLRPLTDRLPKALVEVAGISLIERHLERLVQAGVSTVVINLGWMGAAIVERLGSGRRFGLQIVYSPEYAQVLETGGGIQRALPLLGDEPFWVINADVYTEMPLPPLALPDDVTGWLMLVPKPDWREHGDFALERDRVRRSADAPLIYAGMACYRPVFFNACTPGRFSLAPMMFAAAENGELSGTLYTGPWADVGTVDRLAELERQLRQGNPASVD